MGRIKRDTRSIDNGSCIPSGLPEPARWLLGSQLPGARLYHTAHLSKQHLGATKKERGFSTDPYTGS